MEKGKASEATQQMLKDKQAMPALTVEQWDISPATVLTNETNPPELPPITTMKPSVARNPLTASPRLNPNLPPFRKKKPPTLPMN